MTKWRHYQYIPWDPCDQYYQLTDRWGLVPASQLPGVSIIIRVRDTRDQWPPWCEEMVISGYKHCLSQSPLIFPSPPPALLISHFYFQVSMQSNSHSLAAGLGAYPLSHSHLPPIKAGGGSGGVAASAPPQTSPDLECGPVSSDYNEKSPNTWKYQSFQVL